MCFHIWDWLREARAHSGFKHIWQQDKQIAASNIRQPGQVHDKLRRGIHSSMVAEREQPQGDSEGVMRTAHGR